jgi:hypothetical protein
MRESLFLSPSLEGSHSLFFPLPCGEGIKGRVEPFLRFFVYTIRLSFNPYSPSPIPSPLKGEGF